MKSSVGTVITVMTAVLFMSITVMELSAEARAGGGFMRSMAGGMMGGMLGSMLFGGSAGAGMGGGVGDGGDFGMFEIILLAGGGYLLYRYLQKKRAEGSSDPYRR